VSTEALRDLSVLIGTPASQHAAAPVSAARAAALTIG